MFFKLCSTEPRVPWKSLTGSAKFKDFFQNILKKITLKKSNEQDMLADYYSNVTLKNLKNNSSLDKF